ncbi:MAG: hypothetical protein LC672_00710, partial [Acidobacteria bacterium]|nr:hypothetical protein [Acidobacteriota bacterium]
LKTFILPELFGEPVADIDWRAPAPELQNRLKLVAQKSYADLYTKELLVRSRVYGSVGKRDEAARLFRVYGELYAKAMPDDLSKKTAIAEITRVADDADKTVEFTLTRAQNVRIFATGEGLGGRMYDYGWIESAETGKPVWEMKEPETAHAGGAGKNRKADVVTILPAGKYRLRYKSDDSHSFENWNSIPPDVNFWGIAVYAKED